MTASEASSQPLVAGVYVVGMDRTHLWTPLRCAAIRAHYRILQILLDRAMRKGAKAWAEDRAAALRYVERGRATWDKPFFPMTLDADAVQTRTHERALVCFCRNGP